MMILPIKHITEQDQAIYGANLFNLAKLAREDFPVCEGLAISPPEIILETVLKHLEIAKAEIFEQSLEIIKKDIAQIPLPEELAKEIKDHQSFYLTGEIIKDKKLLWLKLLGLWLDEIKNNFLLLGFSPKINDLKAQAIFFIN